LRHVRGGGDPRLVSVTSACARSVDPAAVVAASRQGAEPWFCLEQPDRHAASLATLGCVRELTGDGRGRFAAVAAGWRSLAAGADSDSPGAAPG
jgi:hypothetical protein